MPYLCTSIIVMELFYTPGFSEQHPVLDEQESNHCIQVMRHRLGDALMVVDGLGTCYWGVVAEAHHKRCRVSIERVERMEPMQPRIHIAVAPTKNMDRIEWFAEKATEIGVHELSFILCRHSERKNLRADRIDKVVVAAMKQSQKMFKPVVNDAVDFTSFVNRPFAGKKFIAHCHGGSKQPLRTACGTGENVLVLIGPEGDFSEHEVDMAINKGFEPISLGNSRLRTETAALVACHTVRLMNE
ncbi:16S rRNA (uracil1498-N3)-methyltransferase [Breznakibacter xylanolyticus]|uniref:Ribosomal RNA small subunit methyltransferase E n=2 Tax=Breznakibacter xylanolyticus TaxID=990 RepID=A0A2W7MXI4_9BACT|nr:16S rRNA (uracil1498-N3)-methyltransferase [Breznakibacter xylanolyticus]